MRKRERNMKVLIVEDDEITQLMLLDALSEWGYQVEVAADGEAAWERLQSLDAPRLAIVDWEMPNLNGVSLCQRIRCKTEDRLIYLLMLTSREGMHNLVEALDAGADAFLTKPFVPEELYAQVRVGERLLGLHEMLEYRTKFEGIQELAGAVCHTLNQPLQGVCGGVELMRMQMTEDDPLHEFVDLVTEGAGKMRQLTRKLTHLNRYRSTDYLKGGPRIVDIDASIGMDGMVG